MTKIVNQDVRRTNAVLGKATASFKEPVKKKERRQDSVTQAKKASKKAPKANEQDPLNEYEPQVNNEGGNAFSSGGGYYPGAGLMAYALQAMLLDVRAGFEMMKATGAFEVAQIGAINAYYDKKEIAQKDLYSTQSSQALLSAIGSGLSAGVSFGLTAVGTYQMAKQERELTTLQGEKKSLQGELTTDNVAQVELTDQNKVTVRKKTDPTKTTEKNIVKIERVSKAEAKGKVATEKTDSKSLKAKEKANLKEETKLKKQLAKETNGKKKAGIQKKIEANKSEKEKLAKERYAKENNQATLGERKLQNIKKNLDLKNKPGSQAELRANEMEKANIEYLEKKTQTKLDNNKQKIDKKSREISQKTTSTYQSVQMFSSIGSTIQKGAEAAYATQLGDAQVRQTEAEKQIQIQNMVLQSIEAFFNRIQSNLDSQINGLGSAAMKAEDAKRGPA